MPGNQGSPSAAQQQPDSPAELLGIHRDALRRKMTEHNL